MHRTLFIQPSDSYLYFVKRIPEALKDRKLVVVHYKSDFECTRWTTRTRDLLKKDGKKLNFDCCVGYLVKYNDANFHEIFDMNATKPILAMRLFDTTWIPRVDVIDYSKVSFIEYYDLA